MSRSQDNPDRESHPELVAGLGMIMVLMLVLVAVSLSHLQKQKDRLDDMVNVQMKKSFYAAQMRQIARERTLILYRLQFIDDPFERDAEIVRFGRLAGRFGTNRRAILDMPLSSSERKLIDRQGEMTDIAVPIQERIVEQVNAENYRQAQKLLTEQAVAAQDNVLKMLDAFERLQHDTAREATRAAARGHETARLHILALSGLAVVIGIVLSLAMVRSVRRNHARQRHLATHDNLTQLPNRALLMDRLQQEILRARRQDTLLGLLFIDLDRFKEINDRWGHAVGDRVLVETVTRINQRLRASDTLARLGGDEFILLISDAADLAAIEHIAEELIACIDTPLEMHGDRLQIGASIGIAAFPQHADNGEQLLHCADLAMYAAKDAGRDRWRLYQA